MLKRLALLAAIALSSGCVVRDYLEPVYADEAPPASAIYMSPGLYYQDIVIGGHIQRYYYRWQGPSAGWRYWNERGFHHRGLRR